MPPQDIEGSRSKKTLILGGVRSGKTAYGMACARKLKRTQGKSGRLFYLATAEGFDEGMQHRIARHQEERLQDKDVEWSLVEEPIKIASILPAHSAGDVILVDCLSVWLSNLMYHHEKSGRQDLERFLSQEIESLAVAILTSASEIVLVSSEVGLGFLPLDKGARLFGDMLGTLHQRIAEIADDVFLVAAGLPLQIKGQSL